MATTYKNLTCRGSYVLGSACGRCEKCADEMNKLLERTGTAIDGKFVAAPISPEVDA